MKTDILLDHESVTRDGSAPRVLPGIEGNELAEDRRIPLNLALVLDRSSSMEGEPIACIRAAAQLLIGHLSPGDMVSVIAFGSRIEIIAERHTGVDRAELLRRIGAIGIERGTNMSGGWLKGRDQVARGYRRTQINRILLLTDGRADRGITDPIQLTALCRVAAEQGVTTSTIGVGKVYHERLLAAMADAGRGRTYHIEAPDQAAAIFEAEIRGAILPHPLGRVPTRAGARPGVGRPRS